MTNKLEKTAKEIHLLYLKNKPKIKYGGVATSYTDFMDIADYFIAEQRKLLEEIRKKLMPVLPMGSAQGYTNEVIDRKLQELNNERN